MPAEIDQISPPRLHPLDLLCPRCGTQKLAYLRRDLHGDVWVCSQGRGGCGALVVHRRLKGRAECGIRARLNHCRFSDWRPCGPET